MLEETFQLHIDTHLSFLKDKALLIAISGGLDSVVLTHLCVNLGLKVSLAHCNFNLRGAESDGDESFVIDLAKSLAVEVFTKHFDTKTHANTHRLSIQMAARELRYTWFEDLSEALHFDYILTAHHADDVLETFLINLSRGTGISGLLGIPEVNSNIVRPLLPFSRERIEHYAKHKVLQWREDSSNASTKYLRNALRHEIIPELKTLTPNFIANFQNTLRYLKDAEHILTVHIKEVARRCVKKQEKDAIFFDINLLKELSPVKTYLYHMFEPYGFSDWEAIKNLLFTQSGKQVVSKTHILLKNREELVLSTLKDTSVNNDLFLFENSKKVETPNGTICIEVVKEMHNNDCNSIFVDADKIKYPIKIRKWQKGDYFCPFGMPVKKKLSKFFKDEKLSLIEKNNVLLLCSEEKIVWVINYRLDDRFKVSNTTNSILKISCNT